MKIARGWVRSLCAAALLAATLQLAAAPANADTITASSWGNITADGGTSPCCYNIGYNSSSGPEYRGYFEFNLSTITPGTEIYGLTLSLFEPAYASSTSTVDFNVGSYGSSVSNLTSSGSNAVTAFNALGSGTVYGSGVDMSANDGKFVVISLDGAAAAAMEALEGTSTPFVLGTYVVGLPTNQTDSIFQSTGSAGSVNLTFSETPVPEPASLTLLAVGIVGLRAIRRRRAPDKSGVG